MILTRLPSNYLLVAAGTYDATLLFVFSFQHSWQALREAWHRYEAEGVVSVMAEWKASFWEERYDIYNDAPYWVHK